MKAGRQKPMLICFAGIDGSGKSEQAHRLVEWLNGQGIQTQYVWHIFEPWLLGWSMKVARKLFLRGHSMFGDYDKYHEARSNAFRRTRLGPVFRAAFLGEYLLRFALKTRWPLLRGRVVVCDRYVYDAVIGLGANLHYSEEKIDGIIRTLLRIMPRPDLVLLIDLPEEVAFTRKNDVPSISYLQARRGLYLASAIKHGMKVLDGDNTVKEVQKAVQAVVAGLLDSPGKEGHEWPRLAQGNHIAQHGHCENASRDKRSMQPNGG